MEFQYLKGPWKSSVPRARTMDTNGQVEGKLLTREMHKNKESGGSMTRGLKAQGLAHTAWVWSLALLPDGCMNLTELFNLHKEFTPHETGRCDIRLLWAYRGTIQRKGLVWCLGHQYSVNVSFLEKATPQTESKGARPTQCISLWPFSYLFMKDKIISSRPKYSDSWPWEQDTVPKITHRGGPHLCWGRSQMC